MDENVLAVFDFDGTITSSDSLPGIIRYIRGELGYLTGLVKLAPVLFAYKTGRISNSTAKERLLSAYFEGMDQQEFQQACDSFSLKKISPMVRHDAMAQIRKHQQLNHRVIVVSASCENWISAWCLETGVECIGTRLDIQHNKLTGKFNGKNCYGQEKVNRLAEIADLSSFSSIFAYGDSAGDKQLLEIATHPNYRVFKN